MALTQEQQQALDELMRHVPKAQAEPPSDWLKTWLGVSKEDLKFTIEAVLAQKEGYQRKLLAWVEGNPLDAMFEFISAAAWAFYQAEKDVNPKISSYVDSLYYIATCASVGYADVFAVTQSGRAIASLVMLLGPALTSKALDKPAHP